MKNQRTKSVLLLLFMFLGLVEYFSAQPKNNYLNKIEQLESKSETVPLSASEYYNLGTSYAKLDSLGPARLYLEKAHLLNPWNKNTNDNIQWVKTELASDVAILPAFFLSTLWRKVALSASPLFWQLLGFTSLIGLLLFSARQLFKRRSTFSLRHWILAGGILLLTLICFVLSANSSGQIYAGKRSVVVEAGKGLKVAPESAAQQVTPLYPGTVVSHLESAGDWIQVRSEDGSIGWMPKKNTRKIFFERTD